MSFRNIILGPVVALDNSKEINEHLEDIIEKGFIPTAIITDLKHKAFIPFKTNKEYNKFKTVAVVITVQYIRAYE